jgi:UDPglucose--hexose-1-phosphate uridylyltransferase
MNGDVRIDPHLGTVVHIVGSRQRRPNLPHDGCPFCVGGREAPEPYSVRSFPNRWPALGEGRCEVVLYTPDHDASFASLGVDGVRAVIDLWAQRTAALRAEPGVNYVLIFENRGAEVGATISHPHGQIYAFDHVPDRQARLLKAGWTPDHDPGDREVLVANDWTVVVPHAPIHPVSIDIAPRRQVGDLVSLSEVELDGLAAVLVDVMSRLDRFYERDLPYMLWINQAPVNWSDGPPAWLRIEIVSPWRSAGLSRFIAAAEVATGEYFNPVEPSEVARRLRELA